jgi:hypothetical protein
VDGQLTPEAITNRPTLRELAYRVGRYATFDASMITALSSQADQATAPMAGLRTREQADFTIALIDSWAVALDILTFYSERLANEAFLRTAVELRSVSELAALVGYVPSPGVAASAALAFTLSTAPGSPASVLIPAGTRVQSVPGPGQTAQVFETSADLTALAAWNALPAQTTTPWALAGAEQSTWIAGTANHVSVGDALLFVAVADGAPSATGPAEFHYVTAVQTDPVAKATQLTWDAPLSTPALAGGAMYAFRVKAPLYGANAPNPQTLTTTNTNISHVPGYPQGKVRAHWDYIYDDGTDRIHLDSTYPGLAPQAQGDSGAPPPPQWLVLTRAHGGHTYTAVTQVTAAYDHTPGYYTLTSKVTTVTLALVAYLVDGAATTSPPAINTLLHEFVPQTPEVTAYTGSIPLSGAPLPVADWTGVIQLFPVLHIGWLTLYLLLATCPAGMLPPAAGASITVVGGQQVAAGQAAGVSGKRVRLQVATPLPGSPGAVFTPAGSSGGSAAASGQVFLVDAFPPVLDPGANGNWSVANTSWSVLTESGIAGTLAIPLADPVPTFLAADKNDPVTGEAVTIQAAAPQGDLTELTLAAPLSRLYDLGTFAVNANAVLATNGQTVQEILGSGDATNAALSFTLKQAPLTYVTAPVASGTQSTLQVWVNNLRWQQAPSLLHAGPADRVYTTSVNPAGNTVVQFGDGTRGTRPPTGQANIRAVYRAGIGLGGMVSAGQLTQPLDRPQGLSGVTNPSAATGAADPATANEIRSSAPLPTLTISRVVSLQDYQDYALGFTGIAMALATWMWAGNLRGVFLTVAGANGATLQPADPVVRSLVTALRQSGDPNVPLMVVSYQPVRFTFTALVAVDPAYDSSAVVAAVWQAVSAAFAFGKRSLGQRVAASELIELIQPVSGVVAVQVTGLQLSGQPATAGQVLRASGPQPPGSPGAAGASPQVQGAQLLVLDPAAQGQIGVWS